MFNKQSIIDEIVAERDKAAPIPRERAKGWMESADIDILGATFWLLIQVRVGPRITPPLQFEEYQEFAVRYLEQCFRENPVSEWADSNYSAGQILTSWFLKLYNDPDVPRQAIRDLKEWMAKLYREGGPDLRTCIVHGTLEHLCEHRRIAKYFSDWQDDPILRTAYEEAMEWARTQPRRQQRRRRGYRGRGRS